MKPIPTIDGTVFRGQEAKLIVYQINMLYEYLTTE
jgi:hypothetical protein